VTLLVGSRERVETLLVGSRERVEGKRMYRRLILQTLSLQALRMEAKVVRHAGWVPWRLRKHDTRPPNNELGLRVGVSVGMVLSASLTVGESRLG